MNNNFLYSSLIIDSYHKTWPKSIQQLLILQEFELSNVEPYKILDNLFY